MKCYKFNRDRSFAEKFNRITKSRKKLSYMIGTNRSRLLDSCYFESQTWGALHKAWKGYIIAKNKYEFDRQYHYAEVIQKLQKDSDYESLHSLSWDWFLKTQTIILLKNLIEKCRTNKIHEGMNCSLVCKIIVALSYR